MTAHLNIISEKMSGIPHAACLFEYDTRQKWYGWTPGNNQRFARTVGAGHLDETNLALQNPNPIAYFARFKVTTNQLWLAEDQLKQTYFDGSGYKLYLRDCISLMLDVCRWCGLSVPQRYPVPTTLGEVARNVLAPITSPLPGGNMPMTPNVFPHELFFKIVQRNPGTLTHFGSDKAQPYPWN